MDLSFIKFSIFEHGTSHLLSHRVVPVKALKKGYRHLRLKNPQNQQLSLSSLFIYTSSQEEGMEIAAANSFFGDGPSSGEPENIKRKAKQLSDPSNRNEIKDLIGSAPVRRRMFFLVVHGVIPEEPSTILKITQESTTSEVVAQALAKANKSNENINDYVLIEEVGRSWDKKQLLDRNSTTQRILELAERPLEAQANWKGEGRFILKKIADDPSSRAWMTTIKAASVQKEKYLRRQDSDGFEEFSRWSDEPLENFLVCVYNVSPDQPYAILKTAACSTSQDIISQALLKARRMEDPKDYVIVEEIETFASGNFNESGTIIKGRHRDSTAIESKRILEDKENVYRAQANWKGKGLFRLVRRVDAVSMELKESSHSKTLSKLSRTAKGSLKKLNKISRISSSLSSSKSKDASFDRESTSQSKGASTSLDTGSHSNHYVSSPKSLRTSQVNLQRPSSSSAEIEAETKALKKQLNHEGIEPDLPYESDEKPSSFARLKRLSFKLKVWR